MAIKKSSLGCYFKNDNGNWQNMAYCTRFWVQKWTNENIEETIAILYETINGARPQVLSWFSCLDDAERCLEVFISDVFSNETQL